MPLADEPQARTRTISYDDYLRLLGLLTLAADHGQALREIERSAAKLLHLPDDSNGYFDHLSDEMWDDRPNAAALLGRLNITVEPPAESPTPAPAPTS